MKKFVIERNLPGAGNLTEKELQEIARTSCDAIGQMGKPYHWVHSYIADDKIYCVHIAESEDVIREHARIGKFPINRVTEVRNIIDPVTATGF